MSLLEKLRDDLKTAMRRRDDLRRSVLRYLLSELHNQEIARQRPLTEEEVLALLSRQAQQRRDSIEAFQKGGRQDLVDKEQAELEVILEYLPRQLSREEIREEARKAIEEVGARGPQDMGRVMGHLMPRLRGRAEGREVSAVVSELLRSLAG